MNETDPVDVLARTCWGEARGTGAAGMRHVASVVMNRVAHPGWWGGGVISVCRAPYQFSCWLPSDPNRAKLEAVTTEDGWFTIALGIAQTAVAGKLVDDTQGADSYFALSMPQKPTWTAHAKHTMDDGWHSFWITRSAEIRNVSLHSLVAAPAADSHIDADVSTDAETS